MTTLDPGERQPNRRCSERRQADRALRECEERYQALFASVDCVYLHDLEGRFLEANPAALRLLGYEHKEILTLSFSSLLDDDDQRAKASGVLAELKETGSQKVPAEFRLRRRTGEYIDVETKASVILRDGQPYAVLGVGRDITERKRAERELQIASQAIEHAGIGVMRLDQEGRVREVNGHLCQLLGYSREELLQMTVFDVTVGLEASGWPRRWEELKELGPITFEEDYRTKSGKVFAVEISSRIVEFDGVEYDHGFIHNITERKQAEEALQESQKRFQALTETTNDFVWEIDAGGLYTYCSPQITELWGYKPQDMIGSSPFDRMAPEDRQHASEMLRTQSELPRPFRGMEIRSWDSTGRPTVLEASGVPFFDTDGRLCGYRGISRDITERKRVEEALRLSEERLRESQKMEAVGQLAGGIAHDFNNLLTAILGYSDMILARGASSVDEVRPDLEEIKMAGERASALTKQILAFSRRQTLRPQVVSLDGVLRGIETLLRRTIGEHIDLVIPASPGLAPVEVDPRQFEQVLINLVLNARDAMPSGGRLTIETADVQLDREFCRTHLGASPGSYVVLRVSDTGVGMDQATKEHIFEPFFTTKPLGAGTGLGLATVYGIVKQSLGFVLVKSEKGEGTSLEVYLPRSGLSDIPEEIVIPPREPASGSETVMVVEDEAALRGLIDRVLGGAGYRTITFGSGAQALEALERGESPVDMLLTDVMLPGALQGHDLAAVVLAAHPDLPVLFISGYSRDALVHAGRLDQGVNLLEKPFTPEALANMVRTVLDQARARV